MAPLTIKEVMGYECPLCECEFEIDTRGGHCQRFVISPVVLFPSHGDRPNGFSSSSEKTGKFNHLEISEQRQHFPLSHLKTRTAVNSDSVQDEHSRNISICFRKMTKYNGFIINQGTQILVGKIYFLKALATSEIGTRVVEKLEFSFVEYYLNFPNMKDPMPSVFGFKCTNDTRHLQ